MRKGVFAICSVLFLLVLVGSIGVLMPGCGPTGVTLEEAIAIAIQRVEADGVMSLDGRDTESVEEETYWHIYFPFTSNYPRGGEPHVLVNKTTSEVIDIYYTQ